MERSADWMDQAKADLAHARQDLRTEFYEKHNDSLTMRTTSSGSAKITFPRYDREEVVHTLKERVDAFREALPATRVVLFGSYATGRLGRRQRPGCRAGRRSGRRAIREVCRSH